MKFTFIAMCNVCFAVNGSMMLLFCILQLLTIVYSVALLIDKIHFADHVPVIRFLVLIIVLMCIVELVAGFLFLVQGRTIFMVHPVTAR